MLENSLALGSGKAINAGNLRLDNKDGSFNIEQIGGGSGWPINLLNWTLVHEINESSPLNDCNL